MARPTYNEVVQMLARTLAAVETPGDLTSEEVEHVKEDAGAMLSEIEGLGLPPGQLVPEPEGFLEVKDVPKAWTYQAAAYAAGYNDRHSQDAGVSSGVDRLRTWIGDSQG